MRYSKCPVCGFGEPFSDWEICPSCGTEFGYDDCTVSHEQLRKRWMEAGANWWSSAIQSPVGWNPIAQLIAAEILPIELSARKDGSIETTTKFAGWEFYPQLDTRVA
jgi:hypothetical protein